MTRTPVALIATTVALLIMAAPAAAATPFTGPTAGSGWDLVVGGDGSGHAAWVTDEPGDRVQYCRIPAGGSACDAESDLLAFPGGAAAEGGEDVQVFTPAANKVVILASCYLCGAGGASDRTWRWISTNNGVSFSGPVEVGSLQLNGQAAYLNAGDIGLAPEGTLFQGADDGPSMTELNLGGSGLFVYSPSLAPVPGGAQVVHAVSNLDTVKYAVFTEPTPPIAAADLNTVGKWQSGKFLPSPEGDNDETHLSSGPNGVFLSYVYFVPNDNRIGLRRFDDSTDSFGGAAYVEGPSTIDNNSADYPFHSQDANGRLHFVWRSLHDGGRLRYTRSDDAGASWTPVSNLAVREAFIDPVVEAGPSGTGFAIWGHGAGGATTIRMVAIDPQFEADPAAPGGGGPDTADPTVGDLDVGDRTLLPGQGTAFTFNSSEAGRAVLTIQKRVKGRKVTRRGRRRCVPATRARLRRVPRRRRCKTWKKVGQIRKNVAPGRNTIVFTGRIAGRRLSPGRYRALLEITDSAGNVSRTESLRFRVVKRRRRG
jgi:hypothetical protein